VTDGARNACSELVSDALLCSLVVKGWMTCQLSICLIWIFIVITLFGEKYTLAVDAVYNSTNVLSKYLYMFQFVKNLKNICIRMVGSA
jgi:hypothetical protein